MKTHVLWLLGFAAIAVMPLTTWAQAPEYPITVIAPGTGPYSFPPGYRTPWDQVQIMVKEKMSPNLFVLHGSEGLDTAHPDGSGGRVMVLFGPDGVLMVDTQNRQVAEDLFKPAQIGGQWSLLRAFPPPLHSMASKKRSNRSVFAHFQNSQMTPSMEKNRNSARPIRFWRGIYPTSSRNRLSRERSRLSPMAK